MFEYVFILTLTKTVLCMSTSISKRSYYFNFTTFRNLVYSPGDCQH